MSSPCGWPQPAKKAASSNAKAEPRLGQRPPGPEHPGESGRLYNHAMSNSTLWLHGPRLLLSRARQWRAPDSDMGSAMLQSTSATNAITQLRDACFAGQRVNASEHRAVGHWALRLSGIHNTSQGLPGSFAPDGKDLMPQMRLVHQRSREIADQIRAAQWKTSSGRSCTDMVHLGIGGSDTGPHLLIKALQPIQSAPQIRTHFLPNLDAHALMRCLASLDPARTLVTVVSKSFSTLETLMNAEQCLAWMKRAGIASPKENFLAVTAQPEKAQQWGISPAQILWFDESIGGRFSLWGPVSLTARIALGNAAVDQVLAGGVEMDAHFVRTPLSRNLPALLAATDFCNLHQRSIPTLMVSAYDSRLDLLLPYLKQLWMESLGKRVDPAGNPISGPACPILWGDVGTNAQHAFFQLLHQGGTPVAVDLIGVLKPDHDVIGSHQAVLANLIAQAQALSIGQQDPDPQKSCAGGHPVNLLMLDRLDGQSLGSLIALWEHRVLCLAALSNVNPFDQWGVELGKRIAHTAAEALTCAPTGRSTGVLDATSLAIIDTLRRADPKTD